MTRQEDDDFVAVPRFGGQSIELAKDVYPRRTMLVAGVVHEPHDVCGGELKSLGQQRRDQTDVVRRACKRVALAEVRVLRATDKQRSPRMLRNAGALRTAGRLGMSGRREQQATNAGGDDRAEQAHTDAAKQ
ncbi:MAG: hypothetical protein QM775_35860 [Pirellulales bacterium]